MTNSENKERLLAKLRELLACTGEVKAEEVFATLKVSPASLMVFINLHITGLRLATATGLGREEMADLFLLLAGTILAIDKGTMPQLGSTLEEILGVSQPQQPGMN